MAKVRNFDSLAAFPHFCPNKRDIIGMVERRSPVPNYTFIRAMYRPFGVKNTFLDH